MKKRVVAWIFLSVVLIAVLSFGFFTTGETFKSSPPGELTRSITPTEIQCTDQDGDNVRIESYVLVGGGDLPSQIFDSCDVNGDINEQICVGNEPDSFTEPCSDGFACQRAACRGVPEWTQTGFLTAPDAGETDFFGISVAVSGDVMIVGAHNDDDLGSNSGSAYAFRNDGDQWVFEQKLLALDGEASDNFGYSVAIEGDMIAVGATGDDDTGGASGAVYIFRYIGGQWVEEQKLIASEGLLGDNFGKSVEIFNDAMVIGASGADDFGSLSGAAYVFRYNDSSAQWGQEQRLTAFGGGEASGDRFGWQVSISGDVLVISSHGDGDNGAAYVFRYVGDQWEEDQKLSASDGVTGDNFGESVSIYGDTIVVGAWRSKSYDGSVYVFRYENNQWVEKQILTLDAIGHENFGSSLAVFENMIVVGAQNPDYYAGDKIGRAYVFGYDGLTWAEEVVLQGDPSSQGSYFGASVGTDGDSIVVGAYSDDGSVPDSGSAFVFQKKCSFISDLDGDEDVDEDDLVIFMEQFGAVCGE
ncbi:MAG: hypothetical protein ABII03_05265 [Nanoarchaeota archaeon]|nr:FG-GAP repeat protein [Nanoarchaeota archaeon]